MWYQTLTCQTHYTLMCYQMPSTPPLWWYWMMVRFIALGKPRQWFLMLISLHTLMRYCNGFIVLMCLFLCTEIYSKTSVGRYLIKVNVGNCGVYRYRVSCLQFYREYNPFLEITQKSVNIYISYAAKYDGLHFIPIIHTCFTFYTKDGVWCYICHCYTLLV